MLGFPFLSSKNIKKSYKKVSEGKKPTATPPPKATAWYFTINFQRLVFESFDVHLYLIYKRRPEH